MPIEVRMPALSPTMKSGKVVKWYKNPGDKISSGECIVDIETDKAVMSFEYTDEDGILAKIIVPEGTKDVKVNDIIALVVQDENELKNIDNYKTQSTSFATSRSPEQVTKQEEEKNTATNNEISSIATVSSPNPTTTSSAQTSRVKSSPLARNIAANNNIDLSRIIGTGPGGRIIKNDVLAAINTVAPVNNQHTEGEYIEISNVRKVIAQRLTESKQTIPHFYLVADCMVDSLLTLRGTINQSLDSEEKITINDFIVKAIAKAIQKNPLVNVSWQNDKIYHNPSIDVSVAVALDEGLITPIVTNVDNKPLSQVSQEIKSLVIKAKSGKLKPHEFQGGSVTISNLGMFGVKEFSAIINPPQSCILAVGSTEKRAVVIDDAIKIANVMTVTLSVDHRVIDGALAAQLLKSFKQYIEQPISMLV